MFPSVFRILLFASFAIWFGGFTFYASVVVPIGTDFLGSSRTQGFITQQVTEVLNLCGGLTLALGVADFFFTGPQRKRKTKLLLGGVLAVLIASWIALLFLHPMLDALLQPEHESVTDETRFYLLHRIYLWIATIQWATCWIWLIILVADGYRSTNHLQEIQ